MDDLISRAAAIEAAFKGAEDWDGGFNPKHLRAVPAVDAIPVEWMRDMMLEGEAEESRAAWVVMREWRKWKREQEAHGT